MSTSPRSPAAPFDASTLLFVPGHQPTRFAKASASGADVVCIDLEDAVPGDRKHDARTNAVAWLDGDASSTPVCVRINALATAAGREDLDALRRTRRPVHVLLPKSADIDEIVEADAMVGDAIDGWIPIVESAVGLHAVDRIALEAPRVAALMFGGADYGVDVGAAFEWEPLLHARQRIVQAAALARVPAIDVPFVRLDDVDGLVAETRRAAALGFRCKAAIHPRQVAAIAAALAPDAATITWATAIVAARDGDGARRVDGEMVDAPVVARARDLLARHRVHTARREST